MILDGYSSFKIRPTNSSFRIIYFKIYKNIAKKILLWFDGSSTFLIFLSEYIFKVESFFLCVIEI